MFRRNQKNLYQLNKKSHVFDQAEVRYFKPLVYKSKVPVSRLAAFFITILSHRPQVLVEPGQCLLYVLHYWSIPPEITEWREDGFSKGCYYHVIC